MPADQVAMLPARSNVTNGLRSAILRTHAVQCKPADSFVHLRLKVCCCLPLAYAKG